MKIFPLYTLLLLTEKLNFATAEGGCGFCEGGSLSNPDALIALTSPFQVHSCFEWQQQSSLTEQFSEDACNFIGPFYEAICGCSDIPQTFDQCDLCGSPEKVFSNPSKGLLIPKSNSEEILCSAVYNGVRLGAVPPNDCQVLRGITNFCGGCIPGPTTGLEETDRVSTLPPSIEAFVSNVESPEPTASPTNAPSAGPTTEPTSAPTGVASAEPSYLATTNSSSAVTEISGRRQIDPPTIENFVNLSEIPVTCDLCPSTGIVSTPDKLITMIKSDNKIVSKTCGALLWDVRAGRDHIDETACSFLQPFFGAVCGCSTFTPLNDEEAQTDTKKTTNIETNQCKMCENPAHAFQKPYNTLQIPGSKTTEITCGGLFSGAMKGAVSGEECEILSSLAYTCGGCGTFQSRFYEEATPEEQCIDCFDDNESSMYIYKDFGASGTTFHKAFSAPLHCDKKNKKQPGRSKNDNCSKLLYPELEGCVLAPITSFDDLLTIQSIIPPGKAAYTAVHKDGAVLKEDAETCYTSTENDLDSVQISRNRVSERLSSENCRVENWMEGLEFGYSHDQYENSGESTRSSSAINGALNTCELLKMGWANYNTGTNVPSSTWENGQLSYCNLGPVQEVGAVWAVEPEGQNYGDLRDVSRNWLLPGAVYKCCKKIYSCFGEKD